MSEEETKKMMLLSHEMENIMYEQERLKEKYVALYGQWYPLWIKSRETSDA